jgi:glycosyltransferase involved in cell wall biosynthesis
LLEIVTRLVGSPFRPIVVCGSDGSLVQALRKEGVTTYVIEMPTLKAHRAAQQTAVSALRELIDKERVQLIHANAMRAVLYSLRAVRRRRTPVIAHVRVTRSGWPWEWWLDQYLVWHCRLILANSHTVAGRFRWCVRNAPVRVLYNGIDPRPFDRADGAAFRARLGILPTAPLIGIVGMLEPRKGHRILFEAFQTIVTEFPEARLVVAGDEPPGGNGYRQTLEAEVDARGLGSRVVFAGHLEDIPALMAAVDIVAVPVVQPEGFGRVVIEAYAARRPVVASRLGGLCEIVEDRLTGLLIPPRDAAALREAILDLLGDPALRAKLGEAGRRRVEAQFSLDAMLRQLTDSYWQLL